MLHALLLAGALATPPAPETLVDPDRLMATLREIPSPRAAAGSDESRENLRKTEALLEKRLRELGYEPSTQPFTWAPPFRPKEGEPAPTPESLTWHNIIVEIPGVDLPGEVLIVGAHFDAVPGSPGADDNASGTAALLEIARVLKGCPLRRTVRLAFFNLEECGLVGSVHYVKSLHGAIAPPSRPAPSPEERAPGGPSPSADTPPASAPDHKHPTLIGMISLEMLGYYSDAPDSQKSPIPKSALFDPPTVGDSIALVGLARDQAFSRPLADAMLAAAPGLKVTRVDFMPIPIPDMMRSDHRPFVIAGFPAVMLTDTANFRNPNYHTPGDKPGTIDAKRFALTVRGIAGAVGAIAEPAPPAPKAP